jgi:hypothetical protein
VESESTGRESTNPDVVFLTVEQVNALHRQGIEQYLTGELLTIGDLGPL